MEINLPDPWTFNEFNKILVSLIDISPETNSCQINSLVDHCNTLSYGAQILDYEVLIKICSECKIIQLRDDKVYLSSLGHNFLKANIERFYEVSTAQKVFISEKIIFKGVLINFARDFFRLFDPNFDTGTYQYSISENPILQKHQKTVQLFTFLGIIVNIDNTLIVTKQYVESVYQITADGKALSEQQLEQILMENKKLGNQAENWVVNFEKTRLKLLGKTIQADLVQRISTINTAAGYDILSFNGDDNSLVPNRMIEVKATHSNTFRFYWSSNEKFVASQNPEAYWIYFLKEFDSDTSIYPIMISNPHQKIFDTEDFSIDIKNYLITETANGFLTACNVEELTWFKYGEDRSSY